MGEKMCVKVVFSFDEKKNHRNSIYATKTISRLRIVGFLKDFRNWNRFFLIKKPGFQWSIFNFHPFFLSQFFIESLLETFPVALQNSNLPTITLKHSDQLTKKYMDPFFRTIKLSMRTSSIFQPGVSIGVKNGHPLCGFIHYWQPEGADGVLF